MRNSIFGILTLMYCTAAHAYLPPSFHFYNQMAATAAQKNPPAAFYIFTAYKPLPGGAEENLGSFTIPYGTLTPGGWPALTLLFGASGEHMGFAVEKFGIPIAKESELLRANREQTSAMKEPPNPFYLRDKRMFLKRFRNVYAFVHSTGIEKGKSIWADRENYMPLKISAPCPEGVSNLAWANGSTNQCDLEFRNISSLRRGAYQNSKLILSADGKPLLVFVIDRSATKPPTDLPGNRANEEIKDIAQNLFH